MNRGSGIAGRRLTPGANRTPVFDFKTAGQKIPAPANGRLVTAAVVVAGVFGREELQVFLP